MGKCLTCSQVVTQQCDDKICDIQIPAKCVTVETLPCFEVKKGETLQKALSNMNELICGERLPAPELININLDFSWGKNTDDIVVSEWFATEAGVDLKYYKLNVKINNWALIQDKNPVLLIDRYRSRSKLRSKAIGKYREAGFKHEVTPLDNGRINRIPLTNAEQLIDFNQDRYFSIPKGKLRTGGSSLDNIGLRITNGATHLAFVDLAFRIQYDSGNTIADTGHIGRIRMKGEGSENTKIIIKYNFK